MRGDFGHGAHSNELDGQMKEIAFLRKQLAQEAPALKLYTFPFAPNPTKLQGEDIAHAIVAMLEMNDRGFTTELTVFATNPS